MKTLKLNNVTLQRTPLVAKDDWRSFYFRYISIAKDVLIVMSEEGEERRFTLANRFEVKAVRNFIASF